MTVQNTPSFVEYTADGIQTSFNFTFRVDDASWVLINYLVNFDTITLNLDQDASPGGSVSYTVAPPNLELIRIERATPLDQQLNYTRYDPFDSESHENALDKLTMQQQDTITAYQAADLVLTDGLAQEIIDRMAGDVTLQNNIDTETAQRIAGDAAVTAAYIAADAVITAAYTAADNAQQITIDANTLLITTGGSPGHTHVLADITDYVAPIGTVPAGTAEGQILRWDNGLGGWETSNVVTTPVNASPPTNQGFLRFNTTASVNVRAPQLWLSALNTTSVNWYSETTLNVEGSYQTTESAFPRTKWGFQMASVATDIFSINGSDLGLHVLSGGNFKIQERAAATTPIVGYGEIWAGTDQSLNFTDGLGVTTNLLAGGGGIAAGTVTHSTLRWSGAAWIENTSILSRTNGRLDLVGSPALLRLDAPGAGVNETTTDIRMENFSGFVIQAITDGGANSNFLMSANRTGVVWQDLQLQTGLDITGANNLTMQAGSLIMLERTSAAASVANYGQFWIRDRNVIQPWFTDDAGQDYPLAFARARRVATNNAWNMNTGANDFNTINGIAMYDDGAAYSITTEDSGSLNWPIDTALQVVARGAGVISILEGAGVTLYVDDGTGFVDSAGGCTLTNGACTVYRVSSTEVRVWGSGLTP